MSKVKLCKYALYSLANFISILFARCIQFGVVPIVPIETFFFHAFSLMFLFLDRFYASLNGEKSNPSI